MFIISGNVAYHKIASQADRTRWSRMWPANGAVDGNTDTDMTHGHCAHPQSDWGGRASWMVDLVDTYNISKVTIYNRGDECENECWDFYIIIHNNFNIEISSNIFLLILE